MRIFTLAFAAVLTAATAHAATFGDDFNDNFKDPVKWGADIGTAGTIVEDFEVIGYLFQSGASVAGSMIRPWILNDLPYDADWVVELDVFASCGCQEDDEYFAFGLLIWNSADMFDQLELANYQRTGPIQGWEAAMRTNGAFDSNVETPINIANMAKLQIAYDSAARVVSLSVGTSTPATFPPVVDTWRPFGTFGVQGTGGATANNNWMMTVGDTFSVGMFGSVVTNGSSLITATADLFRVTIPEPPLAVDDAYTTTENAVLNIPAPGVLANDSDPDGAPLTAVKMSDPSHHTGSFTLDSDGSFDYAPAPGFRGIDGFRYRANDGTVDSPEADSFIGVGAVTPTGASVDVTLDASLLGVSPLTVNLPDVTFSGVTTAVPIDPLLAGTLPGGFSTLDSLAFEISTTAIFAAPAVVCFTLPGLSAEELSMLRVFHREAEILVDRTVLPVDVANSRLCAEVSTLSPFVVASEDVSTTTTTLEPQPGTCGDPAGNGVTASDALFTLQAAVGVRVCDPCLCNADGKGGITATDALRVLRVAVGHALELLCPDCS